MKQVLQGTSRCGWSTLGECQQGLWCAGVVRAIHALWVGFGPRQVSCATERRGAEEDSRASITDGMEGGGEAGVGTIGQGSMAGSGGADEGI